VSKYGSITYQVKYWFDKVFKPGHKHHEEKRQRLPNGQFKADRYIYSLGTRDSYKPICIRWGEWCKEEHGYRYLVEMPEELAQAFLEMLAREGASGGYLGRARCALRKLSRAMHGKPWELKGVWHSDPHPERYYTPEEFLRIEADMRENATDPQTPDVISVQWVLGARINEAVYLRGENIDLERCEVNLKDKTKGGQPRVVSFNQEDLPFMQRMKEQAESHTDGKVFQGRGKLDRRTRQEVKKACKRCGCPYFGTHAFRKGKARLVYGELIMEQGGDVSDEQDNAIRLEVGEMLGHHRRDVVDNHYVPKEERWKYSSSEDDEE
jgi:integrase